MPATTADRDRDARSVRPLTHIARARYIEEGVYPPEQQAVPAAPVASTPSQPDCATVEMLNPPPLKNPLKGPPYPPTVTLAASLPFRGPRAAGVGLSYRHSLGWPPAASAQGVRSMCMAAYPNEAHWQWLS